MKLLLTSCLLFIFPLLNAQLKTKHIPYNSSDYLVAANNKHTKKYYSGQVLKIFYMDSLSHQITKAKGRMYVINENEIKMIPFTKKDITSIQLSSIISIGIWAMAAKITTAVNAGVGIALGAVTVALASGSGMHYDSAGNALLFIPIIIAVGELYIVAIAIPVCILIEIISRRSVKRGYHFYVEDTSIKLR